MVKRKAKVLDGDKEAAEEPRRSSRKSSVKAGQSQESSHSTGSRGRSSSSSKNVRARKHVKSEVAQEVVSESTKSVESSNGSTPHDDAPEDTSSTVRQYWLMKAEPESRLEKGHDVKFSIDDLAAKKEPEPWDGIRAYPARNNLRAMQKGDLAFFYHSSCKVPAIVGIMEIVKEHSPDLSAHDPLAPYHDPSSTPDNPKWSVVHVEFKQKLTTPITLKELKEWQSQKGNALQGMQMLKLSRLSVSRVSNAEWRFLTEEMKKRGDDVKL